MKPETNTPQNEETEDNTMAITGDVIGDTAYSERFVLKILLKFANPDCIKTEIPEKTFEDDLCILWDMTAENDVVKYLLEHDILNLFQFALPLVESARITEIIIGIVGNMCCNKEVVEQLMTMEDFLLALVENIKSDDSLILIQVLRLVSAILYQASKDNITKWMSIFEKNDYSDALYFILNNSSNKDLLLNALENFNTISTLCNIDDTRMTFFTQFVTTEALVSLSAAYIETTVTQKSELEREEIERILVITFQIILIMIGFDTAPELYSEQKDIICKIIEIALHHYKKKILEKEMDNDLVDILESTMTLSDVLDLPNCRQSRVYFDIAFRIWKSLRQLSSSTNATSSFENELEEIKAFCKSVEPVLSTLLCKYITQCHEQDFVSILDKIAPELQSLVNQLSDKELRNCVISKTSQDKNRISDNVDLDNKL